MGQREKKRLLGQQRDTAAPSRGEFNLPAGGVPKRPIAWGEDRGVALPRPGGGPGAWPHGDRGGEGAWPHGDGGGAWLCGVRGVGAKGRGFAEARCGAGGGCGPVTPRATVELAGWALAGSLCAGRGASCRSPGGTSASRSRMWKPCIRDASQKEWGSWPAGKSRKGRPKPDFSRHGFGGVPSSPPPLGKEKKGDVTPT